MNKWIVFSLAAWMTAATAGAADTTPKDEVTAAAKKLGDKSSYRWTTTVVVPEDARWRPGPTEGKVEKDGYVEVKMSFNDNTSEFVMKGDHAAVQTMDGGWQSLSEMENAEGPGRFMALMVRSFKAPSTQADNLVSSAAELKKDGDVISGDLTESGAKSLLTFRRGNDSNISKAKGSVKFWIKDGDLSKYEYKVSGTVSFNGDERDVDRTTTVVIHDVGTTKIEVPEAAKSKL
jgi:hypothetical protein